MRDVQGQLTRRQALSLMEVSGAQPLFVMSLETKWFFQSRLADPILLELPDQESIFLRPEKTTAGPDGPLSTDNERGHFAFWAGPWSFARYCGRSVDRPHQAGASNRSGF